MTDLPNSEEHPCKFVAFTKPVNFSIDFSEVPSEPPSIMMSIISIIVEGEDGKLREVPFNAQIKAESLSAAIDKIPEFVKRYLPLA